LFSYVTSPYTAFLIMKSKNRRRNFPP